MPNQSKTSVKSAGTAPFLIVNRWIPKSFQITALALCAAVLAACSGSSRPLPTALAESPALLAIKPAWNIRLGALPEGSSPAIVGNFLALSAVDGTVLALEASTGRELWRGAAGSPLATGAGTDGKLVAVMSRSNELMVFASGKTLWTAKLPALAYTAPFVAGERVFVSLADRSVHAFDGATGRKLWAQSRPQDALVLKQPAALQAVGDTLLVGSGGRLTGLNPINGSPRWEVQLAVPRGANEVERLVDVVSGTSRIGDTVCARAYQASVGCIDAVRGRMLWSKTANGYAGVGGDDRHVYAAETDGRLIAFKRADGERAWSTDRYLYRYLSAPAALGRSVVVGDNSGNLHFVSRDNGSVLNRLTTDSSGIAAAPALAGDTLIAVTQGGGVYAFRPE